MQTTQEINFEIIKQQNNGWTGLASETVKLQKAVMGDFTCYQVTHDMIGKYDTFQYKTLRGAEKRYARIANVMVVK
jgi:hypothetical protein